MKPEFEQKINKVITEAKDFISQYTPLPVLPNDPKNTQREVFDEFAKHSNMTNQLVNQKKNLLFLIVLLTEGKNGISPNTPSGTQMVRKFDNYLELVKALVASYRAVEDGEYWALTYYNRGGGLMG